MLRRNRIAATVWACFLGANTPQRLAGEWDTTVKQAARHLRLARQEGFLRALAAGDRRKLRYWVVRKLEGMT